MWSEGRLSDLLQVHTLHDMVQSLDHTPHGLSELMEKWVWSLGNRYIVHTHPYIYIVYTTTYILNTFILYIYLH